MYNLFTALMLISSLTGCFAPQETVMVRADGSGTYESVLRYAMRDMFEIEMAESGYTEEDYAEYAAAAAQEMLDAYKPAEETLSGYGVIFDIEELVGDSGYDALNVTTRFDFASPAEFNKIMDAIILEGVSAGMTNIEINEYEWGRLFYFRALNPMGIFTPEPGILDNSAQDIEMLGDMLSCWSVTLEISGWDIVNSNAVSAAENDDTVTVQWTGEDGGYAAMLAASDITGTAQSEKELTRAEAVYLLYNLLGGSVSENALRDSDALAGVDLSQWDDITQGGFLLDCGDLDGPYKQAAVWSVQESYLYGTKQTSAGIYLSPDDIMTREMFITMLFRGMAPDEVTAEELEFMRYLLFPAYGGAIEDEADISAWAKPSFDIAKSIGFLPEIRDNRFLPKKGITQYEADYLFGAIAAIG